MSAHAHAHGPVSDEPSGAKALDARLLRRLWGFVRPHRLLVAASLLVLLGVSGHPVQGQRAGGHRVAARKTAAPGQAAHRKGRGAIEHHPRRRFGRGR